MNKDLNKLFKKLFEESYKKCFHRDLDGPMTETESKHLCVDIEEKTGLVLGFKSIKNYSIYLFGEKNVRKENPSLATLDTLARFVLKAPLTNEQQRQRNEDHYSYWFLYQKGNQSIRINWKSTIIKSSFLVVAIGIFFLISHTKTSGVPEIFIDNFIDVGAETLKSNSWQLVSVHPLAWERRSEESGFLKMFTLEGDNWPDSIGLKKIKNLLIRPVDESCFVAETHLVDFFPRENWQQAGLILMEDTSFSGKTLRLSIAFNGFFGGFDIPPEIIVQGITAFAHDNPEEFLHHQLFKLDSTSEQTFRNNLRFCRLRIEKSGDKFRFLLAAGPLQNTAYKEIGNHTFSMNPKYIGIFALKGHTKESGIIPVLFDSFEIHSNLCK